MRDIFDQARRLPKAERAAFLDGLADIGGSVRAQVEDMLAAMDEAGLFLSEPTRGDANESPTANSATAVSTFDAPVHERPGARIGNYKLLQLIGEGGFGTVFMAEQEKPVVRKVALKVIKLGMDTRQVIARFEAERQALAMMDHPNIARVLDAGATEAGRPFFVMELVKGDPIVEYCDKNNLSVQDRLELFAQVCHAVQHAHTKGIIHRDIKPSNVLVSTQDGKPFTKVIDFGIAKATASKLTEKTLFTEHRQLIGTPEYMSPEQAEGNLDIDTRTDVYSLGVLLYELLTGTTPFSGKDLRSAAYAEIQRIIREVEPPKPSTRLNANTTTIDSVAAKRDIEPKRLGALIRGELDWIVMKSLEKDRQRRYETANGLAMDIRRYLSGEAVVAAPPSASYRVKKFVRRNRGPVTAGAVVAAALFVAAGVSLRFGLSEARQRAEAVRLRELAEETAAAEARARTRAEAIAKFVTKALKSSDPMQQGRQDTTIAQAMAVAVKEIDAGAFGDDPETEAALRDTIGMILKNAGKFAEAEALLSRALSMREAIFKGDHSNTALSLTNLGILYRDQDRLDKAGPLLERASTMFEKTNGPEHPDFAASLNALAGVYYLQSQFDKAEPLLQRALSTREKVHGPVSREVAVTLNDLAVVYQAQGKPEQAESLLKRSLEVNEKTRGPDHPDVAAVLNSLADLYEVQGRNDLAEAAYVRALTICEKALGPDHPLVATAQLNLGVFYSGIKQFEKAEALYLRSLAIREKLFGPDHDNVGVLANRLGLLYSAMGRPDQAEPFHLRDLSISEKAYGPEHPDVVSALVSLAVLNRDRGDFSKAEAFITRAISISTKLNGPESNEVAQVTAHLALIHQRMGRPVDARREFDEVIRVFRKNDPTGSAGLARFLLRSASLRLEVGSRAEVSAAVGELEEAVPMAEKFHPPDHAFLNDYRQLLEKARAALAEQGKADGK